MKIATALAPGMGSSCSLTFHGDLLPHPIVDTTKGLVQGRKLKLKNGFIADTFHGIPYAKPPVGELRFKKPVETDTWDGILKCTRFRDRSVQSDMFWDKLMQSTSSSEDCLYLNVYAPTKDEKDPKQYPVLFYIHGGGFMMDSPARMVPRKLVRQITSKGIVLVTVQYRLGYLGFFSTGDDACPGNMGMHDMVAGLRWTKENIERFGGNPADITVGGQSAGGVSVDLLSLSPLSRDLFKKKIVMGGNSFCTWAVAKTEEITDYCRQHAVKLGWKPQPSYGSKLEENNDMMSFLREVPAHKFATTMHGNHIIFSEARLPLAPVYDKEFLPRPVDILRKEAPKMESIVGVGEEESLLFAAIGFLRCNGKDIDNAMNMLAKKNKTLNAKEVVETVQRIYGDTRLTRLSRRATAQLFVTLSSDIISNYACWQFMQHSQTHDKATYAYSFDYTSNRMYGWLGPMLPVSAGTHASDIIYLMDVNYFSSPFKKDKTDVEMCKLTADYFTSFVKTGSPNSSATAGHPKWTPLSKTGPLDIFSISLTPRVKKEVFGNRMVLLQEIVDDIVWSREAHALCPVAQSNLHVNGEADNREDYLDLNHNRTDDDHLNYDASSQEGDVVSISSCDDEHQFNDVVELAEEHHPHMHNREVMV